MRVEVEEIDSLVLGGNVLTIKDYDSSEDFSSFERDYCEAYRPRYVACKMPAQDLAGIHRLESFDFRYVEFQLSLTGKVKHYDLTQFPYRFEEVTGPDEMAEVLQIASSIFVHDRFSVDPSLGSGFSADRYRRYVEKSFQAKNEFLHRLSMPSGEIVAFVTHRELANHEAVLLLGGVKNEYKTLGLGLLNDQYVINELHRKGFRRFLGNFSGINYPVMNMEIRGLGLRIVSTSVVMRKLYPEC
jgi:hypothetical protein